MVPFITMLLILGLTLPACTCQKTTETPTSPEEQVGGGISFKAAEYVNTEYGFSVKYPEEWGEQPSEEPTTVFYCASEKRVRALSISVQDGATFSEALTSTLTLAGSDIKIVTERTTTLADGTPASEAVVKWEGKKFWAETFALGGA